MARRILITGGAGFIGAHLAAACVAAGDEVHAVVRPGGDLGRIAGLAGRLRLHRVDLCDGDDVRALVKAVRPETLFHLGVGIGATGRSPADALAVVRRDLANLAMLLDAAMAVPPVNFIRTGSLAEYGFSPVPSAETARDRPADAYAAGLAAGTAMLAMLALPFPAVTARLALVHGAGQSNRFLVPLLVERCLAGQSVRVERPAARRDLLHVDDAVSALRHLAAMAAFPMPVVNIGSGCAPTMRQVAELVAGACNADPALLHFGAEPHPCQDLVLDVDLARDAFGWRAAIGLEEGLARTIAAQRLPTQEVAA